MSNRSRAGLILAAGMLMGAMLAGCGGQNEASDAVCLKFARFLQDGEPVDQRWDLLTSMSGQILDAEQNLRDAYSGLYLEVDDDAEAWLIASEAFAQACYDNNWEGIRNERNWPAQTESPPLARR